MDHPSISLVEAARGGDREAFASLVAEHWARMVRFARTVVGELEAEDAVQEAFIASWRGLPRLTRAEAFGSWLARIVFRRCLRLARRRLATVSLEAAPEECTSSDPVSAVAVEEILARLAPRQRAVLHLTVVEGMSDTEIAGLLGITAAGVRSHRRRARESVARLLGPRRDAC
jgi:RNA polymerase sigma-70 factor (ECF subfamily)